MAGEIIYADLDISPGKQGRKLDSLPQPGTSGCPQWHRTALWASWSGILLLGVAVVVVGYLFLRQQLGSPGSCKNESRSVGDGTTTLENVTVLLNLRKGLCLPKLQGDEVASGWLERGTDCLSEGEGCKLCPTGWTLRGTKCYWVSSEISSWNESRQDCVNQRAELLTLWGQDELDFIKEMVRKPSSYFWIGLSIRSTGEGWTWLNGSCLDRSRFQLSPRNAGRCGAVRESTIVFDTCSSGLQWICQKEATQL
ncbi:killer cell lectin-like receptor subfamily B member 1B allele C isoform X1 [Phalacrocorax carbo]|uniref:killer cell lectin-like receptor subfamily B member 1B allele C isoform X1 n=1 Tax=Phalacrocorax carbo TaxID=9209 RepID=UPI003119235E